MKCKTDRLSHVSWQTLMISLIKLGTLISLVLAGFIGLLSISAFALENSTVASFNLTSENYTLSNETKITNTTLENTFIFNSSNVSMISNELNVSMNNLNDDILFDISISEIYQNSIEQFISGNITLQKYLIVNNSISNLSLNNSLSIVPLVSGIELNIYPDYVSDNFTICTYYINGTLEFNCTISNEFTSNNSYIFSGISEIDNVTYYFNSTINVSEYLIDYESNISKLITENISSFNLSENVSNSENIFENITSEIIEQISLINMNISFAEAYNGRFIFGNITLFDSTNNKVISDYIELDIVPVSEPGNMSVCSLFVDGNSEFNCTLINPKTGLYNVTGILDYNNNIYLFNELTYVQISKPELNITVSSLKSSDVLNNSLLNNNSNEINGLIIPTFNLGAEIKISSKAMIGDELFENSNISLQIEMPDNSTVEISQKMPELNFIVDTIGVHKITAKSIVLDNEITSFYEFNVSKGTSYESGIYNNEIENSILINSSLKKLYEENSEVRIEIDVNNISFAYTFVNESESTNILSTDKINNILEIYRNVSITIYDSDNNEYSIVPEFMNGSIVVEYHPIQSGNYTLLAKIGDNSYSEHFDVDSSKFVEINYVLPAINLGLNYSSFVNSEYDIIDINNSINFTRQNKLKSFRNISVEVLNSIDNKEDILFNFSSGSVNIFNLSNSENISIVQVVESNDSILSTDVFAIDSFDSILNLSTAQLVLEKKNNVEKILYCSDWNYMTGTCPSWSNSNIYFEQNDTHIWFNVTHFTAYAGGGESNSLLEIFDSSDLDKENIISLINSSIKIYANYTDNLTTSEILTANCNVSLENYGIFNLTYSGVYDLYFAEFNITQKGIYDYNVSCSSELYDSQNAQDNITVYSLVNIDSLNLNDVSYGYDVEFSARILDAFNDTNISNYIVSFNSDKEGYLGDSITDENGIAKLLFTPNKLGTHIITANISSDYDSFNLVNISEFVDSFNVNPSKISSNKTIKRTSTLTYNISIIVENKGNSLIRNITASDFVPNYMNFVNYSSEPDSIINNPELGSYILWNITKLEPFESNLFSYIVYYNSTNEFIKINELYRHGIGLK